MGRENVEGWQVVAYSPAARNALLRLKVNEFVCLQGVPTIRTARIDGETIIQRSVFPEAVMALRADGGFDGTLLVLKAH